MRLNALSLAVSKHRKYLIIWTFAIVATFYGVRYGLPPKEGPIIRTVLWFPFGLLLFIPFRSLNFGMFVALLQFPLIALAMTLALKKWSFTNVVLGTLIAYLLGIIMCFGVVTMLGIGQK